MRYHDPVMLAEVVGRLRPSPGRVMCDGTIGTAGHAIHLLEGLRGDGTLIGLDRDPAMVRLARERLLKSEPIQGVRVVLQAARYDQLPEVLEREGIAGVDGVLLDLGLNSLQVDTAERGFSFSKEGPLDARFNPDEPGTVSMEHLVNSASEEQLASWLRDHADERFARQIARRIVQERKRHRLTTTRQLAEIVSACYPPAMRHAAIHPATRTFQALRIVVNRELELVEQGIRACAESLNPGGTMCVISYHSGEDRTAKRIFDELGSPRPTPQDLYAATTTEGLRFRVESRGSAKPTDAEVARNPRARSARLRTLRRLGGER